ncbi:MAG: ribonuclease R [Nitrospinota bacterium]|nr:ribonuclease R [Nitrospinota bacterium]
MKESQLKKSLAELLATPLPMREILVKLKIKGEEKVEVKSRIRDLAQQGHIIRLRGARYGLPEKMDLVIGVVQGHRDGYGFVIPDDPDQEDLFLKAYNFHEVMHGDRVVARVERQKAGGKREGRVVKILERANETMSGVLETFHGGAYVVPFERRIAQDIFIPPGKAMEAADGQAVVARITIHPSKTRQAMGEVIEVLGDPEDPQVEIQLACSRFHIRNQFPLSALEEAKKATPPAGGTYDGRIDFRGRQIVTIDGETAKDFDDAVEVQDLPGGGWELGVHIADVSHYVTEGSSLDKEAALRGTSVYFPGTVIPMLPFELSNEICSLNPRTDRFTLSCVMQISPAGEVTNSQISESVISTVERMTYTDVAAILEEEEPSAKERYADLVPMFRRMGALAEVLRERRHADGALDFDLPESEVILDITGRPENIIRAQRNVAHKLIEEFMLLANKTVAAHLHDHGARLLSRVHERPDPMKIDVFLNFISAFGIRTTEPEKINSKWLANILTRFSGRPEQKLVTHVMLRSMKQARYSAEARGHFALAFAHYAHFTSPIRRYPDLIIHRTIKRVARKEAASPGWEEGLDKIAEHCSTTERAAEEAERDIVKLKQTQYMANRVGEEFEGMISGVTNFGFFVELDDPAVEGLVRISTIGDDYYIYDETGHTLTGDRNGKVFRLGDPVRVLVSEVSVQRRQIDFELIEASGAALTTGRGNKSRSDKSRGDKSRRDRSKSTKPASGRPRPEGAKGKVKGKASVTRKKRRK